MKRQQRYIDSQPIDPEEIWSMPPEKNEKVWCVTFLVLFAGIVFVLMFV